MTRGIEVNITVTDNKGKVVEEAGSFNKIEVNEEEYQEFMFKMIFLINFITSEVEIIRDLWDELTTDEDEEFMNEEGEIIH